jgi:hypothetical protein
MFSRGCPFHCRQKFVPTASETRRVNLCWYRLGIFRLYEGINFPAILNPVRATRKIYRQARAKTSESTAMDTNTLLIILVVIFLFGGFGFYGRGRWF